MRKRTMELVSKVLMHDILVNFDGESRYCDMVEVLKSLC